MTAHEQAVTASDTATHELPPSDSPLTDNALPSAVTAEKPPIRFLADPKSGTSLDVDTGVVSELRDSRTGRFVKGHAPLAGGGRPKKGESLLAYTKKLVEKPRNLQAVAEAKLDRLLERGSVGNRAWAEYRDTYYGMPKQTLVLEQGESPLAELLRRRQERQALVVDGTSRVLDDNATPHADDDIT